MIQLDNGSSVPTNCVGSPYGWLLISQQYSAMISNFLTSYFSGHKAFNIYTDATSGSFCSVNQVQASLP